MLRSRLQSGPRVVARASHAIRSATSDEDWFAINSTNVDEIVSQPLPAPERQIELLLGYLRRQAEDSYLAEIEVDDLNALSAVVGAVDGTALLRLAQWAAQEGLLVVADSGRTMALTPKGWSKHQGNIPTSTTPVQIKQTEAPVRTTKGHCPRCGPDRRAQIKAAHEERWEDDNAGVWGSDTYNILKCGGCDTVYVQHENLFSENVDYEQDAAGDWHTVSVPETKYWPSPSTRARPDWVDELDDDTLKSVLKEVYGALDNDHRILAAIGARTALDRAMVLLGATADNFPSKLAELGDKGIVSLHEKDQLLVLTDAGSASAHRAWHPSATNLETVVAGMENFLHRTLVYGKDISAVRKDIPVRPKPPKPPKPI